MLKIYDVQSAHDTILRRDNWLEQEAPPYIQAGIERIFGEALTPADAVRRILEDVRARGDAALREWTARIDGVELETLRVPAEQIEEALETIPEALRDALELAAGRIRDFHRRQPLPHWSTTEMGGWMGQRVTPLRRVGIYVPGGTAPLPSSLLMTAIPAQVAGVPEIVAVTPPGRDGVPAPILAAAAVAGIDHLYALGGAQAIAALAYGTKSIQQVDKIAGPGNLFVTLAKQQVYGQVGIDGLYGPTETMIIADEQAHPRWLAADLLAQAEHDRLASAILLTPSRRLAESVQVEVGQQLENLPRGEIAATALAERGGIVLTADLDEAARLADDFAAEHLCLDVDDPRALAEKIASGGCFFLGGRSFEVLGDYVAGPSHSLPTGGTARFASPLNVFDFVRINSFVALDAESAAALCDAAALIAEAEELDGHANAARVRRKVSARAGREERG
ncbi:MAG: histidinol dehydrogenase [Candidatus Promineifilaceae bacterium]|nr:histidinol dehydrogenase [Candidatus Promineifilaceae bacterium]